MNIKKGTFWTLLIAATTIMAASAEAQIRQTYPQQRAYGSATRQVVPQVQTPSYQNVTLSKEQMAQSTLGASFADSAAGVVVRSVFTNSPAHKAGLNTGDVISKLNGNAVPNAASMGAAINGMSEGDVIKLTRRNSVGKVADVDCSVSTMGAVLKASNVPEAGVYGPAIAQAQVTLKKMEVDIRNATQELEAMKKQYADLQKRTGELKMKAEEVRKQEQARKAEEKN